MNRRTALLLLILLLSFNIIACGSLSAIEDIKSSDQTNIMEMEPEGSYSTPEEVAAYLHRYKQLPSNYLTKKEATALGWESQQGNLWEVADGMSIGGDAFGNREGRLPQAQGRKWYECDVNYQGGFRGAERLVYSNDGLIYYTKDHYQTFTEISLEER
ncbi:MAG: ribonuclease domain-containing protein [Dehalobacterium sp.]|jgi:ribonuclease T1